VRPIKQKHILALLALIAFFPVAALEAEAQTVDIPKGWVVHKPAAGLFSISMPNQPKVNTENMGGEAAGIKTTYHTSESDDAIAIIADMHNLPLQADRMSAKDTNEIFDNFRTGLTEGFQESFAKSGLKMDVKFEESKSITFGGLKGIDQNVTIGTFKARTRMLLAKDHIYLMFVMGLGDDSTPESVINSFKYLGK
jgi:hypothetical protein